MASEEYLCQNYLFLKPKEATLFDLIHLLYSSNLEELRFVECSDQADRHINNFRRRWLIFISVVAQKLLLFMRIPLTIVGNVLELCLNLLSSNGGFLRLLYNLFTGKVVKPDRSSEKFMSVVGFTDKRVELDRKIKPINKRKYYTSLSLMAAKISYENQAFIKSIVKDHWKVNGTLGVLQFLEWGFCLPHWTLDALGVVNMICSKESMCADVGVVVEDIICLLQEVNVSPISFIPRLANSIVAHASAKIALNREGYLERFSTEALLLQDTRADPSVIVVAFRGTSPFDATDWSTDIDISWYELQNVGKIHGGFMKALGLQPKESWPKEIDDQGSSPFAYYTIRKILRKMLQKNKDAKFIVTGHSLGGALAILFVFVLVLHEEASLLERLEGVYTFGQPRVGDSIFGEFMNKNLKKYEVNYLRFVYSNDIVPRLPYDDKTLMFKHFGDCLYFNSCYKGKVLVEEPNKNYFNLLWIVPKYLNAVWELIRSFIIPYTTGPDYRESWFMRFARVIGLVIPGLPPHGPQDYNNVTRLGSITYSAA
ncbi:hypothetical protein EZV62_021592 [Acer yangbiense]|uniref:Fungal lipase-type domain-containing protein n=1 Tax=Acer yangbiense TaxID=1000413 RepID=A0A5C7H5Q6_9ROSI|nr:hypothetical protein EZV62_021592 [Acer yangbiense]